MHKRSKTIEKPPTPTFSANHRLEQRKSHGKNKKKKIWNVVNLKSNPKANAVLK